MIRDGCGFDPSRSIVCTSTGCFASPSIQETGPVITTLTGKTFPQYIVVSHRAGWITYNTLNVSASHEVLCFTAHLNTKPSIDL
jgi:hypothetical protein